MQVNKTTGIITDFEGVDKEVLLKDIRILMYDGEITEYIRNIFDNWSIQYVVNTNQSLLCMSTVFPMRVLDSLLKKMER